MSVLRRWAPRVVRALSTLPPLRRTAVPQRRAYLMLPRGARGAARRHLATFDAREALADVSLFTVPKHGKPELRLITDARNANARVHTPLPRLAVRPPDVAAVARFLQRARFATASDFRNYFHSLPLGRRLRALFYVPAFRRALRVLPMGFLAASDWAAAATGAIAALPVWRGKRVPYMPTRYAPGVLCNADNILVAGPSVASVAARAHAISGRAKRVRATFSQPFAPPARRVEYYGIDWDLSRRPTRGLPVAKARRARELLLAFARSRGRLSPRRWAAATGTAAWVGTVCSVDVVHRYALIHGMRAATHAGGAVPGAPARAEARRHAEAAMRRVPLTARASFIARRVPLSALPVRSHVYVSDAASPGAVAVLHYSPGTSRPRLVHWRRVPPSEPALFAELSGIRAAAAHAARLRIQRPVFVTDARACLHMVRRGVARNAKHALSIRAIRTAAPSCYLVWLPTEAMRLAADGPSRASSRARAALVSRSAVPFERLLSAAAHTQAGRPLAFHLGRA